MKLVLLLLLVCGSAICQVSKVVPQLQIDEDEKVDPALIKFPTPEERKKFSLNSCYLNFKPCGNACWENGQDCCYCDVCWIPNFGLTQTCSCCPYGYKCCPGNNIPNPVGKSQKCCPVDSECGPGNTCKIIQRALMQPPTCKHCGKWTWPPWVYSEAQFKAYNLDDTTRKSAPVTPA